MVRVNFQRLVLHRALPAISHCSHLLLKCRVATNIGHWLKVQSRWFNNYIFAKKKCILISFWTFYYNFLHTFNIIVPHFTLCMLDYFNTIRVSNSLDPDQARHNVRPDLGPKCLQRLSVDNTSHP